MTASLLTTTTAPILTESMPLVMCVEYMANHAMTTGTMGGLRRLGWCTLLWAPTCRTNTAVGVVGSVWARCTGCGPGYPTGPRASGAPGRSCDFCYQQRSAHRRCSHR